MKKIIIPFILISTQAHADLIKWWCPAEPKVIRFPRPAGECYPVDDSFDPRTAKVVDGQLVIDSVKEAEINLKKQQEEAKQLEKSQKIANCAPALDNIDNAKTASDLKEVIKCLMK